MTFKFQSDSINTLLFQALLCAVIVFKFQSDSINTTIGIPFRLRPLSLNSNLILLIHVLPLRNTASLSSFKFQSDSINTYQETTIFIVHTYFKFQSDSINTREKKAAEMLEKYTLNSNLILLILHSHASFTYVCFTLNSNLILLILLWYADIFISGMFFKFQSDSINTKWTTHRWRS